MPLEDVRCPKCGSLRVEKKMNQEYSCSRCGRTFYYVTPNTHSEDLTDRYNL